MTRGVRRGESVRKSVREDVAVALDEVFVEFRKIFMLLSRIRRDSTVELLEIFEEISCFGGVELRVLPVFALVELV